MSVVQSSVIPGEGGGGGGTGDVTMTSNPTTANALIRTVNTSTKEIVEVPQVTVDPVTGKVRINVNTGSSAFEVVTGNALDGYQFVFAVNPDLNQVVFGQNPQIADYTGVLYQTNDITRPFLTYLLKQGGLNAKTDYTRVLFESTSDNPVSQSIGFLDAGTTTFIEALIIGKWASGVSGDGSNNAIYGIRGLFQNSSYISQIGTDTFLTIENPAPFMAFPPAFNISGSELFIYLPQPPPDMTVKWLAIVGTTKFSF